MKQTPVQWLYDQIGDNAPYDYAGQIASYLEEAMKMEKEIPELTDEEIEKVALQYFLKYEDISAKVGITGFVLGMKAYREQLKQRQ